MELINTNNENYFDPTPKLKSSPIPIFFIPFKYDICEDKCIYCGNKYSKTVLFNQNYCKNCLFWYITFTTDNEIYLDVYITTNKTLCGEHEGTRKNFCTRNIQEWCEHCSEVLCFKQVLPYSLEVILFSADMKGYRYDNGSRENCKSCGKLIQQISSNFIKFWICSSCYQMFSGWTESTLTKKLIPILYLPWWDNHDKCRACNSIHSNLKLISNCQKWCPNCFIIYIGCRNCLTTNIIFGITGQTQCKKCRRILLITVDIANINSGNQDIDQFLDFTRINLNKNCRQIANYMNDVDKNSNLLDVYKFVRGLTDMFSTSPIEWIPYSQITNLEKIAEGGFSIIYKATMPNDRTVAVKKISHSQDISKCFLDELKSLYQCRNQRFIIKCYGITQDPKTKEYMLIIEYANGGNLHNYLKKNFKSITWNTKLCILWKISEGLNVIHKKNFIHRDFHSGNILLLYQAWLIADLGLSQPANNTSYNNKIYGVIPYIAPEVFKGATFSKESDIYSLGMIMWELTTGCKPFANVEHDTDLILRIIDGKRPKITNDTPECFSNLMKRCWNSDPIKRPSISEINMIVSEWYLMNTSAEEFNQAENCRLELILSMELGPEFSEKPHSGAIYTSRPLSSLFSKSTNSSSIISFDVRQGYTTREFDFDINDIQSLNLPNINYTGRPLKSLISKSLPINSYSMVLSNTKQKYISKEYEFDIDDVQSSSSSNINLTIQNSSNILIPAVNSSRKHNIEESEIETQKKGKHVKIDDSLN